MNESLHGRQTRCKALAPHFDDTFDLHVKNETFLLLGAQKMYLQKYTVFIKVFSNGDIS